MWDMIVSVPDHCLSFYFGDSTSGLVMGSSAIFSSPEPKAHKVSL